MKQKKLIFNFFVNRNCKKLTDSRKRAKILADNRKRQHPIETLVNRLSVWGKNIVPRSTKGLFTGYVGRGPAFNKTPQNMVRVVFESADGSSYRGFELPRVKLQ